MHAPEPSALDTSNVVDLTKLPLFVPETASSEPFGADQKMYDLKFLASERSVNLDHSGTRVAGE